MVRSGRVPAVGMFGNVRTQERVAELQSRAAEARKRTFAKRSPTGLQCQVRSTSRCTGNQSTSGGGGVTGDASTVSCSA